MHARSFGDTSIIADVFTESFVKLSIMAKGAKNPRSKFFGHLLPFSALRIIVTGKSEMKTLTQIDSNFLSQSVKGPHDLYTYLYVNELMMRLLPKGLPNQELYDLYQNFVELARADAISELDLRVFELDLLDVLGYGINFHADINNEEEIKLNKNYIFVAESGFMASDNAKDFSGEDIIKIRERNFADISTKKLKQLTQATIMFCLEGKDLNSRQIFRRLEK